MTENNDKLAPVFDLCEYRRRKMMEATYARMMPNRIPPPRRPLPELPMK